MYDIKNLTLWKKEEPKQTSDDICNNTEITELNLTVRSYNCLKRAGCNSVGDIIKIMEDEDRGLRKIRNLGSKSQDEITTKVDAFLKTCVRTAVPKQKRPKKLIRPAMDLWDMEIAEFPLTDYSRRELEACGITYVRDLYRTNPLAQPGWYAVRELFEMIPRTNS